MPNYDLFYVERPWRNDAKRHALRVAAHTCFLFRPGDVNNATHRPDHPLVLTYIHFDLATPPAQIPAPHRVVKDFITLETLLSRYVNLFLTDVYGAEVEAKLILKQAMIHLLREEQEAAMEQSEASASKTRPSWKWPPMCGCIRAFHSVEQLAMRANMSPKLFPSGSKRNGADAALVYCGVAHQAGRAFVALHRHVGNGNRLCAGL